MSQEYAVYGSMVLPPAERVLNLATHSKVSGIPGVATVVVKLFFNLYRLWAGGQQSSRSVRHVRSSYSCKNFSGCCKKII